MIDNTLIVGRRDRIWRLAGQFAGRCARLPHRAIDGIEIDVQMTADGVVVAHHDYRLARGSARLDGEWLTERSAPIKEMTFAELQAL